MFSWETCELFETVIENEGAPASAFTFLLSLDKLVTSYEQLIYQRYTNADLKIFIYARVRIKIIL